MKNFKLLKIYPRPERKQLKGLLCTLWPLEHSHIPQLYDAFSQNGSAEDWAYLPYGPFHSRMDFSIWSKINCFNDDPLFYTLCKDLKPVGMLSLLKIEPNHGKLELGFVHFAPEIQQTIISTEAIYIIATYVFEELKYRRLEWKCDNANQRSKRCATRFGFTFEGLFRQHWIIKSHNRDTAWFSIIDKEWPNVKARLVQWLSPDNFDKNGCQFTRLSDLSLSEK